MVSSCQQFNLSKGFDVFLSIDLVVDAFSDRLKQARKASSKRMEVAGLKPVVSVDSAEDDLVDAPELGPRSIECFLRYMDASGGISARSVAVHRLIETDEAMLLQCFCFARNAPRSFRLDGIMEMVDLSTGEVVGDPEKWVSDNLGHGYNEQSCELLAGEVTVLLALCCADGEIIEDELDVVKLHIDRSEVLPQHQVVFTDKALALTSINEFSLRAALRVIAKSDADQKRKLMRSAKQVVEADGVLHLGEIEALQRLCGDAKISF